jgi:hypothetical protein
MGDSQKLVRSIQHLDHTSFWLPLQQHPVPVREEAISAIVTRSLTIDVYIWLAYRLHALTKSTPIDTKAPYKNGLG